MIAIDDPRIVWHASSQSDAWTAAVAEFVASTLRASLAATSGSVRLLVSGGTTPAPVYQRLATVDLDWSRVVIALVDDRNVGADDAGSNARAIREHLLRDRATSARFVPLRELGDTAEAAIAAANAWWQQSADQPVSLAVLGMGDDGHTASLFPGARDLDDALTSGSAYALIDATGCPVSGAYHHRLSLTPTGLANVRERVLLLRGERKREVLLAALADGPVADMPVRVALDATRPLRVFWCTE